MEQLALEIGRAIRRARLDRGMTLKQLAESSDGRFRPTSLAGYERKVSERSPWFASVSSVVCWTCHPDASSRRSPGRSTGTGSRRSISTKLEVLHEPEGELIAGFIKQVLVQRADADGDTIALRAGDVEVLASVAGTTPDELHEIVSSAQRSVSDSDVASTGEE